MFNNNSFWLYFFKITSVKYTAATLASLMLWRRQLTVGFSLLFFFLTFWFVFTLVGGLHMIKYFFTSIWFWAFTPIACVLCVLLFITGVFGFGKSLFHLVYWMIPAGLPLIFGRLFVLLLLLSIFFYILWLLFKLSLVCLDNGIRGLGFLAVFLFFLIRAFIKYYTAGIVMRGLIVLIYETIVELISLFYFFIWALTSRIQKKSFFRFKMHEITYERYLISKFCFEILNSPVFKHWKIFDKYRGKLGFYCYTYILRTNLNRKERISSIERKNLYLKYMNVGMYNIFDSDVLPSKMAQQRKFLFFFQDWSEDTLDFVYTDRKKSNK